MDPKIIKLKSQVCGLSRSPFIANVGELVGGSAFTQIIELACAPILTRLYTPEEFGLLGVFMAIAAIAVNVAT